MIWTAAVTLAGLALASFGWSSLFYFRLAFSHEARKRWLIGSSIVCMGIILYTIAACPPPHTAFVVAAIAVLAVSLAIFWGAIRAHGSNHPANAFVPTSPDSLVRSGPYRLIRHPFYSSYLMFHVAATCLTCDWLVALTVPWMGAFYYAAARIEERSYLRSPLAEPYAQYVAATGMFLPKLWPSQRRETPAAPAPARRKAA